MRKLPILIAILMMAMNAIAQQKIQTGTVISQSTKEPLAGVTVQAKNNAVTTDSTGRFYINADVGETLSFSYTGMQISTVRVTASNLNLSVALEDNGNWQF